MLGFELANGVFVLQGDANVVEAVEQAVLAKGVDVELEDFAGRRGHALVFEIDVQPVAFIGFHFLNSARSRLFKRHQQNAVLEGIVVEDVGEARRDDHAKAEILKRPGRVLA